MSKKEFKTVDKDGNEISLTVLRPTPAQSREAQKIYNRTLADCVKAGAILREKVEEVLKEQGLWNETKEKEFKELTTQINKYEKIIMGGNIKKTEAKNIAFKLRDLRLELRRILADKTSLDSLTAQGQAENARFDAYVAMCTVYTNTERPYFTSVDNYNERKTEEAASSAAMQLASMLYGMDSDYESKLPENKFLVKFGYVDAKLRRVDEKGRLIDDEGRLIDEKGRFINEEGKYVDNEGNLVDEDGNFVVDAKPFLDDDNNPIE